MSVEDILRLSNLIPILFFLSQPKANRKEKWVLLLYPICSFFHALVYATLLIFSNDKVAFVFNAFFIPLEFISVSIFFFKTIKYEFHKKSLWFVSISFLLIFLIKTYERPNEKFDSFINSVESISFILFVFLFYYESIKHPKTLFIYKQPYFWAAAAFLLFYSTTFFAFLYRQSSWFDKNFVYQYVYIHAIAGIIRNILLAIGVLVKPEEMSLAEQP